MNTHAKDRPNNSAEELDWLAFRFVCNELSDTELLAFEERLGSDQSAREAVARAVELGLAVAVASDPSVASVSEHPLDAESGSFVQPASATRSKLDLLKPFAWMSAGAIACLAAVFLSQVFTSGNLLGPDEHFANQKSADDSKSLELATVWSQVRHAEFGDAIADEIEKVTDDENSSSQQVASTESIASPSWMIAAVSVTPSAPKPAAKDSPDELEEL